MVNISNMFMNLINFIIASLGFILSFILNLLPSSPLVLLSGNSAISSYLSTLNFFVPVGEILVITQAWLLSIGLYYLYQIVLRWVKAI